MVSALKAQGGRPSTHSSDEMLEDPLAIMTRPPEGETVEETADRVRREKAALKLSEDIDRELRLEVQAMKKQKCVKILLLGQSESGKSTVLKNFQKKYDPSSFDRERAVWRSVCQLNVARSFGIILDALNRHDLANPQQLTPPISPTEGPSEPDFTITPAPDPNVIALTSEHRRMIMRLAPLRQVEQALTQRFKPLPMSSPLSPPSSPLATSRSQQELHVNGYVWQRARERRKDGTGEVETEDEGLARVLAVCQDDMIKLWNDRIVRKILKESRIGVEELSIYFLDELSRIAVQEYIPSDDDILRARLKTMGVTEHRFTVRPKLLDPDGLGTADLRIYDVGGARSQRATWIPFFDDVNAIVFLAPMSAFDQTLVEARDVNRLEDSFTLWKRICSSKLLMNVSLVLLLNKQDILQRKIEMGISFSRYVKSYQGPNKWDAIAKYLKTKFKAVQREMSPEKRLFYAHVTCATDTRQMAIILAAIEDLVLRRNLEEMSLL